MKLHFIIPAFLLILANNAVSMEKDSQQPCEKPSTVTAKVQVEDFQEVIEEKEIIDMSHVSFILVDPKRPDEERLKEIEEKGVTVYNLFLPSSSSVGTLLQIIEKAATVKIEQLSFFGIVFSKDLLVTELPSGEHSVLSAFIKV